MSGSRAQQLVLQWSMLRPLRREPDAHATMPDVRIVTHKAVQAGELSTPWETPIVKVLTLATLLTLLTACVSAAERDWQPRFGLYSVEDAKRELGPPESCIGLDDGGTACSWTTAKSRDGINKLILTFGPNGKLATFNNVHF